MMRAWMLACAALWAALWLPAWTGWTSLPAARAAGDAEVRISRIRAERARVRALARKMEARLGRLGRELQTLDRALVEAGARLREADAAVREADAKLAALRARRRGLRRRAEELRRAMRLEAAAAWRHAADQPPWLDVLFGASVADVPHRQYMLSRLVTAQADRRREYARVLEELARTETELVARRKELTRLREARRARKAELAARRRAKQALWRKVRRDVRLQKERDAELARQEKALARLLAEMAAGGLRVSDARARQVSVRKLKGRLPWPLKGRIVARFHSRPAPGRPRLAGVQLAPRGGHRQVRAIAPGQVRYADWFGGYGLMMIVDHGGGLVTVYAHNDALYRQVGDWVEAGDVLADAGSTGWVENVRLYFEVRDRGRPVNPVRWCRR